MEQVNESGQFPKLDLSKSLQHIATNIVEEKYISHKSYSSRSEYAYCPYCIRTAKLRFSEKWQSNLPTLWNMSFYVLYQIDAENVKLNIEHRDICPNCKRTITSDDYIKFYAAPPIEWRASESIADLNKSEPLIDQIIRKKVRKAHEQQQ